jgi:hypothetical protein
MEVNMEKITMKQFKEEMNGSVSYFAVRAIRSRTPMLDKIEEWFKYCPWNIDFSRIRKCKAKSNCLIFTQDDEEVSYLYFDGKDEKRSFYLIDDGNKKMYLMECEYENIYNYMGYVIQDNRA